MSGDTLTGRRLVLRGPDDEVQVKIEAGEDGPSLVMYDRGRKAVEIGVSYALEQYYISAPSEDDEGGVHLVACGDGRSAVTVDAVDGGGAWQSVEVRADPRETLPRVCVRRKSLLSDPVLEWPTPSRDGRLADARQRIAGILEGLVESEDVDRAGVCRVLDDAADEVDRRREGAAQD